MKYLIKPIDVLSFRDSRPFGTGDDHKLYLAFPPSPATLYGALRASFIGSVKEGFFNKNSIPPDIKNITGDENSFGTLKIEDYGLVYNDERIYKTPNDILQIKNKDVEIKEYVVASPGNIKNSIKTNSPNAVKSLSFPESDKITFYENPPMFIKHSGIVKYLTNSPISKDDFVLSDEFCLSEFRTGISIGKDTGTVEEGALFSIEFARLSSGSSFFIQLNNELKGKIIKLGGEGRAAKIINSDLAANLPEIKPVRGIKLITITPLFSSMGYLPDKDIINKVQNQLNLDLEFDTISLSGYKAIGGWNIVKKNSKPLRRYLPEGTVIYFKLKDNANINSIKSKIINISNTEDEIKQSFGLSIIGGY